MGSLSVLSGVLAVLYVVSSLLRDFKQRQKLAGIPTVGGEGLLGPLAQPIMSLWNSKEIIQDGYNKYCVTGGGIFKFRAFGGWKVAVTSPRHIEDMRRAPDDVISAMDAVAEALAIDYTFGKPSRYDPFHIDVVKGSLTRNIQVRFADVRDEIVTAFGELLPPQDDWVPINLNPTMQHIICRASNRFFVGLPLCRDLDYIDLNLKYTIKVIISGQLISFLPEALKPILGGVFSPLNRAIKRGKKRLGHIIQERLDQEKEYGDDWPGKPNDVISWILEEARGHPSRWTMDDIVTRILLLNFAAIHTTSMTLTNTLDYLTRYPEYIPKLREEIESVTEEHGWTKQAMGQMRKLDSFLKEVQRVNPNSCFGVTRKVLKDFTLSDGTMIPKGTIIGVPSLALQRDEANFLDGDKFVGFRFADKRNSEKEESIKHQMVTLTTDFFLFGHGRHACPGRFFAVNELKALVAHILLTYDIKAETPGVGAKMMWLGPIAAQDNSVKYLFRKRRGD